jgi:hypothetical protein
MATAPITSASGSVRNTACQTVLATTQRYERGRRPKRERHQDMSDEPSNKRDRVSPRGVACSVPGDEVCDGDSRKQANRSAEYPQDHPPIEDARVPITGLVVHDVPLGGLGDKTS